MVGPRGSFWHTAGRELTDDPAAALLELHRAGVPLVLVSGRTLRAGRRGGPDLRRRRRHRRAGRDDRLGRRPRAPTGSPASCPPSSRGRTPMAVMAELGVVDRLIAEHPGRLEWHAPWHATHDDRRAAARPGRPARRRRVAGRAGPGLADAQGQRRHPGDVPDDAGRRPAAAAGLPPDAARHLQGRRDRLGPASAAASTAADAVAIGDSVSDLEMAPAVGRLWITANGAAVDGMAEPHRRRPQRRASPTPPMGEGWAQAVRASL